MEIESLHKLFLECSSVSTDTRKIDANSMFVALKGANFDANTFAEEALKKGAKYVIIDNEDYYIDSRTILVSDSLVALQELGKFHRSYLKLPIIGLTGSNGKTTTKELIQVVLRKKFNVKATFGNLNNHIGVPLTLLSFSDSTEIGIVEMGANHQREIAFLSDLAMPDFGYITNFGKAHLEGFGGVEGVVKGKKELYDHLRLNRKLAFVNLDDPIQSEQSADLERYTFGSGRSQYDVNFSDLSADPFVFLNFEGVIVKSNLLGGYNSNNIMAAIAIGTYFGVSNQDIVDAIESYSPNNNRSQLMIKGSNQIILDAYNANPSSMAAALNVFVSMKGDRKVAILGDMFELGEESASEHAQMINSVLEARNIQFLFVGNEFSKVQIQADHFNYFPDFGSVETFLRANPITDSTILIKGSRGMALERVLNII
ncbi:MAG: UDP-N-acetylmuramoyl-tripeptide--D-alanyl-D-alanine ligase [Flavobacterium sp.]|nr:UDP-N-acetylmuramoyl-tripeptide--D-alanyl-D-alanine ligase [Flavobacterium sp.]